MADLDNITEQAAVEAELRRLKEQQTPPPTPPEGTETGIPPAEKAEEKPLVEVMPEGEGKPVETKPETPPPPAKKEPTPEEVREGILRRQLREANRELERLRAAQKPEPASQDKPKTPTVDEDPVANFDTRISVLDQEIQRLRAESLQDKAQLQAQQVESEFARSKPDYFEARKHLLDSETKEWELSGLSSVHQTQLAEAVRLGRAGDSRFSAYTAEVDRVSNLRELQDEAEAAGRTPEEQAIYRVARDTYISQRGQGLTPEKIYAMAEHRGYRAKAQELPQRQESGDEARRRVLQAQNISEAGNSLSESSTGEAAPGPRVVRKNADIIGADDSTLDAFIATGKWREMR